MRKARHILICGEIGVGKSTLIKALLAKSTRPVAGFLTKRLAQNAEGDHPVHIYPAAEKERASTPANMVGLCAAQACRVFPAVFNTLGVQYLSAPPGSILVMDELGFLEAQAEAFTRRVLDALSGDIPVIAAVKARQDVPFLNQVRSHPNAALYTITKENRDALYHELLPILQAWNDGAAR